MIKDIVDKLVIIIKVFMKKRKIDTNAYSTHVVKLFQYKTPKI